ncbi:MAG TPA: hypothetical protein PLV84_06415 [Deltaproteobacteria bacterium]|nr:hypothetical protein [Deltaproteobacteria bacterium]
MPLGNIDANIQRIVELSFRRKDFPKDLFGAQQKVLDKDEVIDTEWFDALSEELEATDDLGIPVDGKPDHGRTLNGQLFRLYPYLIHIRDEDGLGHFPYGIREDISLFDIFRDLSLQAPAEPRVLRFPDIDEGDIIWSDVTDKVEEKVGNLLDPDLHIGQEGYLKKQGDNVCVIFYKFRGEFECSVDYIFIQSFRPHSSSRLLP